MLVSIQGPGEKGYGFSEHDSRDRGQSQSTGGRRPVKAICGPRKGRFAGADGRNSFGSDRIKADRKLEMK